MGTVAVAVYDLCFILQSVELTSIVHVWPHFTSTGVRTLE